MKRLLLLLFIIVSVDSFSQYYVKVVYDGNVPDTVWGKNGNDTNYKRRNGVIVPLWVSPKEYVQPGNVSGLTSTYTPTSRLIDSMDVIRNFIISIGNTKQNTLVSGTNIKTVNGSSLVGSGDVSISSAVAWGGVTGTLSNQTDLVNALALKATTATTDSMRTNIYNQINGKQPAGTYATGTGTASGTNTGDNAVNTTYANDYRAANFVAGTNYLAPDGNGSSLTGLTKSQVGLSNVDNTSDASKPVSTATQTALNLKANLSGASFTGGVGYGTGAGGTVTQATNKSTGVTLNKLAGRITMNGAALAAAAEVAFTLTNSFIASTDVVIVNVQSVGTAGAYLVSVGAVSAGSCSITVSNASAGSLSQAIVLNFVVIKGVSN